MITFRHKGNFKNTENFLNRAKKLKVKSILEKYGVKGVNALSLATPLDTGLTASSWNYKIEITNRGYRINWINTNVKNGVPIAILLQYGHGTRGGTYVQGIDYINPAIKPIFDEIAEALWKEVTNL